MGDRIWVQITCNTSDGGIFEKLGFGRNMQSAAPGISVSCDEYPSTTIFPSNIPWIARDETDRWIGACDGQTVFWHACDESGWPSIPYDFSAQMVHHKAIEELKEFLTIDARARKLIGIETGD
jgi:hypothetical protein